MGIGTLIMCAILSVGGGAAEVPSLNTRQLKIPINFNPERRDQIVGLQLWVSTDDGVKWVPGPNAHPSQTEFVYAAPSDGVYWLTVQVTNTLGQKEPADLRTVPPERILKVNLDTKLPAVRVEACERGANGVAVSWHIDEPLPRTDSLRLEYRPADAGESAWVAVPIPNPLLAGQGFIANAPAGALKVRVSMADVAGNVGSEIRDVAAAPPVSPPTPVVQQAVGNSGVQPAHAVGGSGVKGPPNLLDDPQVQKVNADTPAGSGFHTPPGTPPPQGDRANLMKDDVSIRPTTPPPGVLPPPLTINGTQITLDYEVVKQGPSGLRSVELWLTKDDGRNWERFADDPDRVPPLMANLPGDGVYGLKLVSYSGASFSQGPPSAGDPPDSRVEVDTKRPEVSLTHVEPNPNRAATLVLRWVASDKNLTDRPISLEWSAQPEGPWSSVAPGTPELANTGSHVWELPVQLPPRVYLRIAARDRAGNVGEYKTLRSVLVDTITPQLKITDIRLAQPPRPAH